MSDARIVVLSLLVGIVVFSVLAVIAPAPRSPNGDNKMIGALIAALCCGAIVILVAL